MQKWLLVTNTREVSLIDNFGHVEYFLKMVNQPSLTPFLYGVVTENAQQHIFYKDGDKATGYIRQGLRLIQFLLLL
ncbi:hypothetical protein CXF81_08775 [Glaciecola sp. 33A]|jgi:hypothetical protein|nr:hypothetical protein CXF81_08775 [Glaciecola sp. 33A]